MIGYSSCLLSWHTGAFHPNIPRLMATPLLRIIRRSWLSLIACASWTRFTHSWSWAVEFIVLTGKQTLPFKVEKWTTPFLPSNKLTGGRINALSKTNSGECCNLQIYDQQKTCTCQSVCPQCCVLLSPRSNGTRQRASHRRSRRTPLYKGCQQSWDGGVILACSKGGDVRNTWISWMLAFAF